MGASDNGHHSVVKTLLAHKAKVNVQGAKGGTALICTVKEN